MGWIRIRIWIRIRNKSFRIHNTAFKNLLKGAVKKKYLMFLFLLGLVVL